MNVAIHVLASMLGHVRKDLGKGCDVVALAINGDGHIDLCFVGLVSPATY
jgi:hypothetical protein